MNPTTKFLDYDVIHCTNGDGFVLRQPNGEHYKTHLGNYSSQESAEEAAIKFFMIARPKVFATQVYYRMCGREGAVHDYFLFVKQLEKENIALPEGLEPSPINCCLMFRGKKV